MLRKPSEQNAGQNHNIKIGNESFESVVQLRYFETTPTNKNCTREEIQRRQNSGNACYHWVQICLHFAMKMGIYTIILLPA